MSAAAPILPVLRQFPNGRTTAELARQIGAEFDAPARRRLATELARLSAEGAIEIDLERRWRLPRRAAAMPITEGGAEASPEGETILQATPAWFVREPVLEPDAGEEPDPAPLTPLKLLRYYAAALRSDPRGDIVQYPDRHARQFQLLAGRGAWWPGEGGTGLIRMAEGDAPAAFREALSRRSADGGPIAVGWPLVVLRRHGAVQIVPVGLLAAEWSRQPDSYEVRVPLDAVALNPSFVSSSIGPSRQELRGRLTDDGRPLGVAEFGLRLRDAVAGQIRGRLEPTAPDEALDPSAQGVWNAVALFLPTDTTFTAGAARDLDAIADWSPQRLNRTALGILLGASPLGGSEDTTPTSVLNPVPLNTEQLAAARMGLDVPLGVVTGPPGTGKSQVIVSVVASAVAAGQSVLVASKNHQALDAIEERLAALAPGVPCVVRTLDPATSRDKGFEVVLGELAAADGGGAPAGVPDAALARLTALDAARREAMEAARQETVLRSRLADHIDRLVAMGEEARAPRRVPWWRRLLRIGWPSGPPAVLPPGADAVALRAAIAADRAALASMEVVASRSDPARLTRDIEEGFASQLGALLRARTTVAEPQRVAIADAAADRALEGVAVVDPALARRVVACRPVWVASVLGTPSRIPLVDALFDLVVFDEAGQCDIASALPLLARARRALVVGDPNQLSFIPGLGLLQERNLMRAYGLPLEGMGRYAQSRRTLFDLAQRMSGGHGVILREQFRSAPAIVEYLSGEFYGGRLRPGRGDEDFAAPEGLWPGLHWTDVAGVSEPAPEGGMANPAEAEAVADHLARLLRNGGFTGSVGVIAPFNAQVRALVMAIDRLVPAERRREADLRVATVDRFQGQERDLILFSPTVCAASPVGARSFVSRDWRRVNVAISRARAVAHVVGDLAFARSGEVRVLQRLAARATEPRARGGREGIFDSEWERRLDAAMRASGLDPKPQYPVAGRWLDFALFAEGVKLDVEVDGRRWHTDADGERKVGDLFRDAQLRALGWTVRRFWVDELDHDMGACIDRIRSDLAGG